MVAAGVEPAFANGLSFTKGYWKHMGPKLRLESA